jgi:hypothetical protein
MEMTIIYIVLIVLLLGIIWHIFCHLVVIFHQDTTDLFIKKVLEDPYKYVRDEEMCYFMRNMVYLFFVCMLLFAACNGNTHFDKKTKTTEISNVKDK